MMMLAPCSRLQSWVRRRRRNSFITLPCTSAAGPTQHLDSAGRKSSSSVRPVQEVTRYILPPPVTSEVVVDLWPVVRWRLWDEGCPSRPHRSNTKDSLDVFTHPNWAEWNCLQTADRQILGQSRQNGALVSLFSPLRDRCCDFAVNLTKALLQQPSPPLSLPLPEL